MEETSIRELASRVVIGDLVFIDVPITPFRKVAEATLSWTNHVGVVVDTSAAEPLIAESTFPKSRTGPLSRFVARSAAGRVAVRRLSAPIDSGQQQAIARAARDRLGVRYDTGFDLDSRGQFCSRFAREVLMEGTGITVGEVERFAQLLNRNPQVDLAFWKIWYFGQIPWQRRTVTPANLLESPRLQTVFDGRVNAATRQITVGGS
jgi:hypothetical protein